MFCFNLRNNEGRPGEKALVGPGGEDLSDRGAISVHAQITRTAAPIDTTMVVVAFYSAQLSIDAERQVRKGFGW